MMAQLYNLDGSPLSWPELHERVTAYYQTHSPYQTYTPEPWGSEAWVVTRVKKYVQPLAGIQEGAK